MDILVKYVVIGTIALVAGYFVRNAHGDPAKSSDVILTAGGWLGLLVKVLADDFKANQSLRLSQQERLLKHANELNEEPYSGLIQKLLRDESVANVSDDDKFALAGKLEQAFLEYEFKQVPYAEIHKRYGRVVKRLWDDFKDKILGPNGQKDWWAAFIRFHKMAKDYKK